MDEDELELYTANIDPYEDVEETPYKEDIIDPIEDEPDIEEVTEDPYESMV